MGKEREGRGAVARWEGGGTGGSAPRGEGGAANIRTSVSGSYARSTRTRCEDEETQRRERRSQLSSSALCIGLCLPRSRGSLVLKELVQRPELRAACGWHLAVHIAQ